jgi:hypothetical protein
MEPLERDTAVGALDEALAHARAGAGRIVLVAGEAGVGTAALTERAARDPRHRGADRRRARGGADRRCRAGGRLRRAAGRARRGAPDRARRRGPPLRRRGDARRARRRRPAHRAHDRDARADLPQRRDRAAGRGPRGALRAAARRGPANRSRPALAARRRGARPARGTSGRGPARRDRRQRILRHRGARRRVDRHPGVGGRGRRRAPGAPVGAGPGGGRAGLRGAHAEWSRGAPARRGLRRARRVHRGGPAGDRGGLDRLSPRPGSRRRELHLEVLAALGTRPSVDPARLAHHARRAGDPDAVLRHAPTAARAAGALGAHR